MADIASPWALVVVVKESEPPPNAAEAPLPGSVNVTLALATLFPFASKTLAISGMEKGLPVGTDWPPPEYTAMPAGGSGRFVRLKLALKVPLIAVITNDPTVELAVNVGAVAMPDASVVTVAEAAKVPLAPAAGAVKVTLWPAIALLDASVRRRERALANAAPAMALCPLPLTIVKFASEPLRLVRLKLRLRAPVEAVTAYEPRVPLAVNAGAVATPDVFVLTVADDANVPLAPEAGGVNVTPTPLSGFPNWSVTFSANATANAVPAAALWLSPDTIVIRPGDPAVLVTISPVLSESAEAVT